MTTASIRKQSEARKVMAEHYPFRCCAVCGLQNETSVHIAHLDQNAGNNDPDNLAWLCPTHHWMYDAGLYPIEAIQLLLLHWQETCGVASHKPRMKEAGHKAAVTRRRKAGARKAAATRKRNAAIRGGDAG
jgi:predicted restriction endonuclease